MTENITANLTLPLVVELSRKPMTLAQVGELQPGQVLELAQKSTDPVELVINGKSIGQGELVEVEGQMAVKVLSLLGT
jgi:flagellar motor switch protein FliM